MNTNNHSIGFKVLKITGWVIGGLALATLLAFVFGYVVMLLWNWIMPELFGLSEINFWMAFGIILLAKILFGGFGHHHKDKKEDSPHKKEFIKGRFKRGYAPAFKEFGKWKHYEDFWEDEGEKAFEDYLSRKKAQKEEKE